MRNPSARVLSNLVDLSRFTPAFDADGGIDASNDAYPAPFATGVPASVQLQSSDRVVDGERPSRVNVYLVLFKSDYALRPKDRIGWSAGGIAHALFVDGVVDAAGKSATWEVTATEKL